MELTDGLLKAVQNYLDMTWTLTPEETEKLSGIVKRGITYLDVIVGGAQDYEKEGLARALLMDYVRYVRSNALDEFQVNYLHELLMLQMATEVPNDTQPEQSTDI